MSRSSIESLTLWILALVFFLPLCTPADTEAQNKDHPASNLPIPRSQLSDKEWRQAVQIGAADYTVTGILSLLVGISAGQVVISNVGDPTCAPKDRTVLSNVESVDDNDPQSRLVMVTTYNYEKDETTRRLVDLASGKVVDEHTTGNDTAPLAKVEANTAEALVLGDSRIIKLLGKDLQEVEVELILTKTQDPNDEFYRKRVVLALFKTNQGYAPLPKVFVNLTNSQVVIWDQKSDPR